MGYRIRGFHPFVACRTLEWQRITIPPANGRQTSSTLCFGDGLQVLNRHPMKTTGRAPGFFSYHFAGSFLPSMPIHAFNEGLLRSSKILVSRNNDAASRVHHFFESSDNFKGSHIRLPWIVTQSGQPRCLSIFMAKQRGLSFAIWSRRRESNPRGRICNPLHSRFATPTNWLPGGILPSQPWSCKDPALLLSYQASFFSLYLSLLRQCMESEEGVEPSSSGLQSDAWPFCYSDLSLVLPENSEISSSAVWVRRSASELREQLNFQFQLVEIA